MNIGRRVQLVWWGWASWRLVRWRFPRANMVMANGSFAVPIFWGYVVGPLEVRWWPTPMPKRREPL